MDAITHFIVPTKTCFFFWPRVTSEKKARQKAKFAALRTWQSEKVFGWGWLPSVPDGTSQKEESRKGSAAKA